jgi:hypothetical protein
MADNATTIERKKEGAAPVMPGLRFCKATEYCVQSVTACLKISLSSKHVTNQICITKMARRPDDGGSKHL